MEQAWTKDKARVEAGMSRLDRSVGVALGKAVEPEATAGAIVRRNLGMTPTGAKSMQAPASGPTAAEREIARRRVQANLGLLPRA